MTTNILQSRIKTHLDNIDKSNQGGLRRKKSR